MNDKEKVKDLTGAIERLRKDYKGQLQLLEDVKKQVDKATMKRDALFNNMKTKEAQIKEGFDKLDAVQKNLYDKKKELDLTARGLDDARTKLNADTITLNAKEKDVDAKELQHSMKLEKDSQMLDAMEKDKEIVIKEYQKKMSDLGKKENELINKRQKEMVLKVHMIDEELAKAKQRVAEHQSKIEFLSHKEDELKAREEKASLREKENKAIAATLDERAKTNKAKDKELEELEVRLQVFNKDINTKIDMHKLRKELNEVSTG